MRDFRFWTVVVLLAGAALLVYSRSSTDLIPVSEPLSRVPRTIADWSGSDVLIDPSTRAVLGEGDFLSRIYTQPGKPDSIGLFMGYFPSQRTGVTIHSPRNCLPGSGWAFESSQYVNLSDAEGKARRVGEYIVANGDRRQFVIYWYQAHGRSIANEYLAKAYLITDAMTMDRTDGALIRITTPIDASEGVSPAKVRAEAFTAQLAPILFRFIPN